MYWVKERIRQIHEALEQADFYWQVGYFGLLLAATAHLGFIFLFWWLDIPWMALVNLGSVTMYAYAILGVGLYTLKTKDDRLIGWLVYSELMGHNLLATYFLGRDAGFQYYIYALVVLPFFITTYGRTIYIARVVAAILVAMWIDMSPFFDLPKVFIDVNRVKWLHHINLMMFLAILGTLAYLYAFYETMHRSVLLEERNKDPLTGLYSHHYIETRLRREEERAYGIVLVDIDSITCPKERQYTVCKERVIVDIARHMRMSVPEYGLVARWGERALIAVLYDMQEADLAVVSRRIERQLQQAVSSWENNEVEIVMTLETLIKRKNEPFELTLIRMNEALRFGKIGGRTASGGRYVQD